ncbi:MAG: Bax inhibitor-1/YccA family protein [Candidatus Limnocylindrales bacterium]
MFNSNPADPHRYEAPDNTDAQRGPVGYGWDPRALNARPVAGVQTGFLTASFVWMFLALLVSAATAFMTLANPAALQLASNGFLLLIIAEFAMVIGLSAAINRLSSTVALLMLFVYAAVNGAMFAIILAIYNIGSVTSAFVGAAAIFGAAALYGYVTGRDLTSLGGLLFAGLIGIVVASLANMFIGGSGLSFVIGIVGTLLFTGLTAFDVQRIKNGRMAWVHNRENASVLGALSLYLDFVNLFLMLLRVTGGGGRG